MDTLGPRIKHARLSAGFTLAELADKLGVTPSAVSQWEQDRTSLDLQRAQKLATALNVSLQWLVEGDAPMQGGVGGRDLKRYAPLISTVTAGNWSEIVHDNNFPKGTEFIEIGARPMGFAMALELTGESMLPEFHPADIVIIDTGLKPLPGDYVVAVLESEDQSTFKKYRPRGHDDEGNPVIELSPLNPDYPPLQINKHNPGRIIGTMIEHRRFRRRM